MAESVQPRKAGDGSWLQRFGLRIAALGWRGADDAGPSAGESIEPGKASNTSQLHRFELRMAALDQRATDDAGTRTTAGESVEPLQGR